MPRPVPAPRRSKGSVSPSPSIPQIIESPPINGVDPSPNRRKKKLAPAPPNLNGAKPKLKKR